MDDSAIDAQKLFWARETPRSDLYRRTLPGVCLYPSGSSVEGRDERQGQGSVKSEWPDSELELSTGSHRNTVSYVQRWLGLRIKQVMLDLAAIE